MKSIKSISKILFMNVLLGFCCVEYVQAASFDDPTWPCQQRKVETLSLAILWTGPLPDGPDGLSEVVLPPQAAELAALLAQRRVTLEEAGAAVQAFASGNENPDPVQMAAIFARVFDALGGIRLRIIRGIEDYSLKQIALSDKIDGVRSEMRALENSETPDFDRIDALEEQLDWDERIFRDRSKSLTYVCETPVLIEKRLYALAQILLKHAD